MEDLKKSIIKIIKQKKELSNLDQNFIHELLDGYIKKNKKTWQKIESHPKIEKSRDLKILVKEIRKRLREVYGVFNIDLTKRNKLLLELKTAVNGNSISDIKELHKKILLTHKSTRERIDYYDFIYEKIFSITKRQEHILDIGSGLNPLSFIFMRFKDVKCTAIEFTQEDCNFLNEYFKIMKPFNIKGIALKMDLTKPVKFPKADICFLFKMLDTLESIKPNISKNLLESIDAKFIVASFPKKSLSGKPISTKRLIWFERLIKNYTTFEIENEIFYIIPKNK